MDQNYNVNIFTWLEECVADIRERNINDLPLCREESESVAVRLQVANSFLSLNRRTDCKISKHNLFTITLFA